MSYAAPINVGGIVRFIQGGTALGWYQLNTPAATLTLLPGISVPEEATGMLICANEPLQFSYSPLDATGSDSLTLPPGGTMMVVGQENVQQFSIRLNAIAADFAIQFYQGDIGPVPRNA